MWSSATLLRWLCWALVVFGVVAAVMSVAINLGYLTHYPDVPDTLDFPSRLALFRSGDQAALPVYLVSNVVSLGVFVIAALLAVALRPFAQRGAARDVMATLFVVGATIGILSQLVIIGVNETAAQGYCDCGFKTEELIAQTKALDLGFTIQTWLGVGALTTLGFGLALAGRLIEVTAAWRVLSYVIAIALFVAAVLQIIGQGDYATLITGFTVAILVSIWAIMLARATARLGTDAAPMAEAPAPA